MQKLAWIAIGMAAPSATFGRAGCRGQAKRCLPFVDQAIVKSSCLEMMSSTHEPGLPE
jgi:hypothetical protein